MVANKELRQKYLVSEMFKKAVSFTTANVLLGSPDNHIFAKHVKAETRELARRARHTGDKVAATFFNEKDMQAALDAFSHDDYVLKIVAKRVLSGYYGRIAPEIICDDVVGVVVDGNGNETQTEVCTIVLELKGEDYRNRFTGMPFDVVTCYPIL